MTDNERPLKERIWEFTKDISVKVSKKAEKHWKINTLRVEIASIKHRINVKYKELGRYVFESFKAGTLEEESHRSGGNEIFEELNRLEGEVLEREERIEILEQESMEIEPELDNGTMKDATMDVDESKDTETTTQSKSETSAPCKE